MKRSVQCETLYGERIEVCIGELTYRPSAYGLLVSADRARLLMVRMNGKGTFVLPGGGFECGENSQEAATREFFEETGLEIEVGRLLDISEGFFYYNPEAAAWQVFCFVYECGLSLGAGDTLVAGDPNEGQPEWVAVATLQPEMIAPLHRRVISNHFGLGWPL